jgi:hypothetical protein
VVVETNALTFLQLFARLLRVSLRLGLFVFVAQARCTSKSSPVDAPAPSLHAHCLFSATSALAAHVTALSATLPQFLLLVPKMLDCMGGGVVSVLP